MSDKSELLIHTLQDSRSLGMATYGAKNGFPVFYFHGFPGCRLEAALIHEGFDSSKVKLISLDRPGISQSSRKKNRTLLDWPDDVIEVADVLGLKQFGILGISGGAPYALSCAYKIQPERLKFVIVVSGMGPVNLGGSFMHPIERIALYVTRKTIIPLYVLLYFIKQSIRNKSLLQKVVKIYNSTMTDADIALFKDFPIYEKLFIRESYYAFKDNIWGLAEDIGIYGSDWGFELSSIKNPNIIIIHGEGDNIIPIEMAEKVASQIPNSRYLTYEGEGHLSVAIKLQDILPELNIDF